MTFDNICRGQGHWDWSPNRYFSNRLIKTRADLVAKSLTSVTISLIQQIFKLGLKVETSIYLIVM